MDKGYLNDLKIHGITLLITIVAEYIGLKKFDLGFGAIVLFPLIYSLIFGGIISLPKMKTHAFALVRREQRQRGVGRVVPILEAGRRGRFDVRLLTATRQRRRSSPTS